MRLLRQEEGELRANRPCCVPGSVGWAVWRIQAKCQPEAAMGASATKCASSALTVSLSRCIPARHSLLCLRHLPVGDVHSRHWSQCGAEKATQSPQGEQMGESVGRLHSLGCLLWPPLCMPGRWIKI